MTEETKQLIRVSDMLRTTAGNTSALMTQIADHIDNLENHIVKLEQRISQLEGAVSDTKPE